MSDFPPNHPLSAYERHRTRAVQAYQAFRDLCDFEPPRVPGMETPVRMAVRLDNGHTVETAAAREFAYRWGLALDAFASHARNGGRPNPFAALYAPSLLGM